MPQQGKRVIGVRDDGTPVYEGQSWDVPSKPALAPSDFTFSETPPQPIASGRANVAAQPPGIDMTPRDPLYEPGADPVTPVATGAGRVARANVAAVQAARNLDPKAAATALAEGIEGTGQMLSPLALPAVAVAPMLIPTAWAAGKAKEAVVALGEKYGWAPEYIRAASDVAEATVFGVGLPRLIRGAGTATATANAGAFKVGESIGRFYRGKMDVLPAESGVPRATAAAPADIPVVPREGGQRLLPPGQEPPAAAPVAPVEPRPTPPTPTPAAVAVAPPEPVVAAAPINRPVWVVESPSGFAREVFSEAEANQIVSDRPGYKIVFSPNSRQTQKPAKSPESALAKLKEMLGPGVDADAFLSYLDMEAVDGNIHRVVPDTPTEMEARVYGPSRLGKKVSWAAVVKAIRGANESDFDAPYGEALRSVRAAMQIPAAPAIPPDPVQTPPPAPVVPPEVPGAQALRIQKKLKQKQADRQAVMLYRGQTQDGNWYTPDKSAAGEYANLDEGGRVVTRGLPTGKVAEREDILAAAQAVGAAPDQSLYWLLSPEVSADAPRVIQHLAAQGFEAAHLPSGEDFAPSGKAIESYFFLPKSQPAASTPDAQPPVPPPPVPPAVASPEPVAVPPAPPAPETRPVTPVAEPSPSLAEIERLNTEIDALNQELGQPFGDRDDFSAYMDQPPEDQDIATLQSILDDLKALQLKNKAKPPVSKAAALKAAFEERKAQREAKLAETHIDNLDPRVRREVRRIAEELSEQQFTQAKFIDKASYSPAGEVPAQWAGGHGNAPVYQDILGGRPSPKGGAAFIRSLIQGALKTGNDSSVWWPRVLDAARRRIADEDAGFVSGKQASKPLLPPWAGDEPGAPWWEAAFGREASAKAAMAKAEAEVASWRELPDDEFAFVMRDAEASFPDLDNPVEAMRHDALAAEAQRRGMTGGSESEPSTPEPAPVVDLLPTGESQPRLPGAEGVREQNVSTPELDVPFSLTPNKGPKAPKGVTADMFSYSEEPPGQTNDVAWRNGDRIRFTGKTQQLHGATFYEFEYLDGPKKGKIGVTQHGPNEQASLTVPLPNLTGRGYAASDEARG